MMEISGDRFVLPPAKIVGPQGNPEIYETCCGSIIPEETPKISRGPVFEGIASPAFERPVNSQLSGGDPSDRF